MLHCPSCKAIVETPFCGSCGIKCVRKSSNPKCCEICHKELKGHACSLQPCQGVEFCHHPHKHERRPRGTKVIHAAKKRTAVDALTQLSSELSENQLEVQENINITSSSILRLFSKFVTIFSYGKSSSH